MDRRELTAAIRAAVQALLDSHPDGYLLGQLVIAMGLERITTDGVDAIPWVWAPEDQPTWQTSALLEAALDLPLVDDDHDD